MKNQRIKKPFLGFIPLALMAILLASSCKDELIEDYGTETVFGYTTSGLWDSTDAYIANMMICTAKLKPVQVTEENATAGTFFTTLTGEFTGAAGWTYTSAASTLSDQAIHIRTYDVQGTSTRVGAEIHVKYVPHGTDPVDVHWIQVVSTNHSLKPPAGHGNSATYVDIPTGQANPYYDDGYAGNATNLYDFPGRSDATASHNWEAITYLCTGPAIGAGPGAIQFLRPGIKWGWINSCSPILKNPWWMYNFERPIAFRFQSPLEPGTTMNLVADSGSTMVMMKEQGRGEVPIQKAELNMAIGPQIDAGGFYPFEIKGGIVGLSAFIFGKDTVAATASEVERGSGYIHWETGEASMQIEVQLPLPGGKNTNFVFTGTGTVDREARTFYLNADTKGVERQAIEELKKDLKE